MKRVNDALNKLRILLGITDRNSVSSVILKIYLKKQQELEQVLRISLYQIAYEMKKISVRF